MSIRKLNLPFIEPSQIEVLDDTPVANKQTIYQAYVFPDDNAPSLKTCVIQRIIIDNTVSGTQGIEIKWAKSSNGQLSFDKIWANRAIIDYEYLISN